MGLIFGRGKKEKCFPKIHANYTKAYMEEYLYFSYFIFCSPSLCFFVALVNGVAGPFSIIAGHMPNPGFWLLKNNTELFYPYEEELGAKSG